MLDLGELEIRISGGPKRPNWNKKTDQLLQLAIAEQTKAINVSLERIAGVLEKTLFEKLEEAISEYMPEPNGTP